MSPSSLLLASLSLASTVLAQNKLPTVPVNGEIGEFRFPLACTVAGSNYPLSAYFTATGPVYAAPGQPIYFSDATSQITLPANLTALRGNTVRFANSQVNVALSFTNANPTSKAIFPNGLWVNNTAISPGTPVTVKIPSTGTIAPIGPITVGSAGVDTRVFFGATTATVYALDANKKQVGAPIAISCPAPSPARLLTGVNVVGPTNTTKLAPSLGAAATGLPQIGDNQEFGYYRVNFNCSIGVFKGLLLDLTFGGGLSPRVSQNSLVTFSNTTSYLTIPQNLVNAAHNLYGVTTFITSITNVTLAATNASPASVNAITKPIMYTQAYNATGNGLSFVIPQTGSLAVPSIKVTGAAGNYAVVSLQNAFAQLTWKNSTGAVVQTPTVSCFPYPGNLDLVAIQIV